MSCLPWISLRYYRTLSKLLTYFLFLPSSIHGKPKHNLHRYFGSPLSGSSIAANIPKDRARPLDSRQKPQNLSVPRKTIRQISPSIEVHLFRPYQGLHVYSCQSVKSPMPSGQPGPHPPRPQPHPVDSGKYHSVDMRHLA